MSVGLRVAALTQIALTREKEQGQEKEKEKEKEKK
jgi:hypothetical protein